MKPCISYYGGKQRMASKIIPLIPQHTVYVEPFCGGATLLFRKPWPKVTNTHHYREVLNDNDKRLTNFYRILRGIEGRELVNRLNLTLYNEEEYRIAKEILNKGGLGIEGAWAYFVSIMQSFSNKLNAGWGRSVFSYNGVMAWRNKIRNLAEYLDRISYVHIACTDALKCIDQWDSPQTFFYCDPPYPKANQGHYSGYSQENFEALVSKLSSIQGSFLLSCYDNSFVPKHWEKFEFKSYCSSSSKGQIGADRSRKATVEELGNRKRMEVVWRRFNRVEVRSEIQKLYDSGKFDCFVPKPAIFDEIFDYM